MICSKETINNGHSANDNMELPSGQQGNQFGCQSIRKKTARQEPQTGCEFHKSDILSTF